MKTIMLAAGAAALVFSAGQAFAATQHKGGGATVAGPSQPIPYPQLEAYLKASPSKREKTDWWSGEAAATGASANTAATSAPETSNAAPAPNATPPPTDSPVTPATTPK